MSNNVRVLVIDDDSKIRQFLNLSLTMQGHIVIEAGTGKEGIEAAILHEPDLLLLDINLPDISGMDVIHQLRTWTSIPIIVLSVHHKETEKVAALDAGADDYVTKPFTMGELSARMRAALRHAPQPDETPIFEAGELQVDLIKRQVKIGGAEVRLTPREYDLLKLLVTYAGKVVTGQQMMREVWGDELQNDIHVLRVHMSNLRGKIEPEPAHPMYIITEAGVGYRLKVS